jgi:hypothetical protein
VLDGVDAALPGPELDYLLSQSAKSADFIIPLSGADCGLPRV